MPEDEIDKLIAQAESVAAGAGDDIDALIAKAEAAVTSKPAEKPRGTFVPMDQLDNPDREPVGGAERPWYYDWTHPAEAAVRASNEVQNDPYFKQRAEETARTGDEMAATTQQAQSSPWEVTKFAGDTALGLGGQYAAGLIGGFAAPEVEAFRQFAKRPELAAALSRVAAGAVGGAVGAGTDAAARDAPVLPATGQGALFGGGITGGAEILGAGARALGNLSVNAANTKLARTAYPTADLDPMRTRGGLPALAEAGQELRDLGLTRPRSLLDVSANPKRLAANATDIMDRSLAQLESADNAIRNAPTGELRESAPGEFTPVTAAESPVDIGIVRRKLGAEARRSNWENNPRAAQAYADASDRITRTSGAQPPPDFTEQPTSSGGLPLDRSHQPLELMSRAELPNAPVSEPAPLRYSGAPPELASLPEQTSYTPDSRAINLAEPVPPAPESFHVERSTRPEAPSWPAVGGIEPSRAETPLYSIEPHGPVQAPPLAENLDLSAPKTTPNEPGLMLNPAPAPPLEMTGVDDVNLFARERSPGFAVPDLSKQADLTHDVSMRMTNADMPWGAERPVGPTSPVQAPPPRGLHQFDQTHFAPELDAPNMSTPDVPAGGADLESPLWTPPEQPPVIEHPPRYSPAPEIRVVQEPVPEKPAPWAPVGKPLDMPPDTPLPPQAPAPPFDMTGALDVPPSPRPPQFPYDPNAYTIGKTMDVRRNLGKEIRDWGDAQLNQAPSPYEQQALKTGWQGLGDTLNDAFAHGTPDPAAVASRAEANKTFSTIADVAPNLAKKANRADIRADRGSAIGNESMLGGGLKGWDAVKNALTGINTSYNIGQGLKGVGQAADAVSDLARQAGSLGWFNQRENQHPEIAKAQQANPDAPPATVKAEANESMKQKIMDAWYNTKGFAEHLFK